MNHEHQPTWIQSIGPQIVREAQICDKYGVSLWDADEQIASYTTAQMQAVRRLAKSAELAPWRDTQMRGAEVRLLTEQLLRARGAWTARRARGLATDTVGASENHS